MDELPLAAFDVETTGLSPAYGERICEVGIVLVQGQTIVDTYQALINPQRPISPGASRVNGLCDEDVRDAPAFAEIADQVLERINGAVMVCHNAPFDLGFLEAEFSRLGLSWQPAGVIDTLELARRYFNFDSNSLSAIAEYLNIKTPHAHRALGDALTTLEVLRILSRQLRGKGVSQLSELRREYHPRTRSFEIEDICLPLAIQEALAAQGDLEIVYIDNKGEETCRVITPRQVFAARDNLYLVAYCHLRQEERHFRLDRIVSISASIDL